MEIIKTVNENELTISLKGELTSVTAPELEKVVSTSLKGIKSFP